MVLALLLSLPTVGREVGGVAGLTFDCACGAATGALRAPAIDPATDESIASASRVSLERASAKYLSVSSAPFAAMALVYSKVA